MLDTGSLVSVSVPLASMQETVIEYSYSYCPSRFGLVAFLLCFVPAQRALDQTCQEAGQRLGSETV